MKDLIKTLLRPDQEEDPERNIIARAANILEVGEFQLLQLAYLDWHGQELPAALCDRLFQAYMLHNEIPVWARHYARRIIEDGERGLMDYSDPFYHRYDREYITHVPQGVRRFTIATMILAVVLVGSLFAGHFTAGEGVSLLPPYFEKDDFPVTPPP
jgi:hypothetical protein